MRFFCSVLGFHISVTMAPSNEVCVRLCSGVCQQKRLAMEEVA